MVHRTNASQSAGMAHSGGGSRCLIDECDDGKLMQEMKGTMMKGESAKGVEAPQNYGFTSLVMPADKGKDGQIEGSAEGFMSYMGGNRSFPVCGIMDDRRHRVKGMEKGDSAMYRTRDDGQQFHLSDKGNYMTCRNDRVQRMALIDPPKDEDEQQSGGQGNGGGAGGGEQKKKPKGQKLVREDNEKSKVFFEQSKGATKTAHDKDVINYVKEPTISHRVMADHVHSSHSGNTVWEDAEGCWSSQPILVKDDPCSPPPSKPGGPAGPPRAMS